MYSQFLLNTKQQFVLCIFSERFFFKVLELHICPRFLIFYFSCIAHLDVYGTRDELDLFETLMSKKNLQHVRPVSNGSEALVVTFGITLSQIIELVSLLNLFVTNPIQIIYFCKQRPIQNQQ